MIADRAQCALDLTARQDIGTTERQWIHILPSGPFTGRDGRSWVAQDPHSIVGATRTYNGDKPLLVDYEHQSVNAPQGTGAAPAAGWIVDFDVRNDGIWGAAEWTDRAAQLVRNREYRFISPVFIYTREDRRVVRIESVALTNMPNLELRALARVQSGSHHHAVSGVTLSPIDRQICEFIGIDPRHYIHQLQRKG